MYNKLLFSKANSTQISAVSLKAKAEISNNLSGLGTAEILKKQKTPTGFGYHRDPLGISLLGN